MIEPTVGTTVHSTEDYEINITNVVDAETKERLVVYGLYNKATRVREAELRALTTAVAWCAKVQADLNEQRKQDLDAETILAAMPDAAVESEDVDAPEPVISEAEMKAMLDGD